MQTHKPIIICGPTASGKTALALQLAQKFQKRNGSAHHGVIINADSRQIYSEIPILSAQPSLMEKQLVSHYLFGIIHGDEDYNVAIWLKQAIEIIDSFPRVIITGGTGMYINALLNGLAVIPEIPQEIREKVRAMDKQELDLHLGSEADGNTNRMRRKLEVKLATGKSLDYFQQQDVCRPYHAEDFEILYLNVPRETIYNNINKRFMKMLESGADEEVKNLFARNYSRRSSIMQTVGVAEIEAYLAGTLSHEAMLAKSQQRSRNYAKRQLTWFRHQLPGHKIDVASLEQGISLF